MNQDASLVEAIFTKCSLVYGRDFLVRWEGMNLDEVKADWERELGPLLAHPDAILYGLAHLPEKPPTVLAFRALCIQRPKRQELRLARPAPTEEERAKAKRILSGLRLKLVGQA